MSGHTVALLYGENFSRAYAFIAAFLIFCALTPSWRLPAYGGALGTGVTALYIDGYDTLAANVSVADFFALVCMVIGGTAQLFAHRRRWSVEQCTGHESDR